MNVLYDHASTKHKASNSVLYIVFNIALLEVYLPPCGDRRVSGGLKYGGLVLQVGGWAWGWQPHPVKILLSGNPEKKYWAVLTSKEGYCS
jgi:hypothetical protein